MSKDEPENFQESKKPYFFGGISVFDLQKLQDEVLNDLVYLDVFAGSDPIFKEKVTLLNPDDALKLLNLKTYKFHYNVTKFHEKKFPHGERIGLMADEVEKYFPQCVTKDSEGHRYVNYSMLVVPLIETIRKLEEKVSILEKKISEKDKE
jgi:hypothetical protein